MSQKVSSIISQQLDDVAAVAAFKESNIYIEPIQKLPSIFDITYSGAESALHIANTSGDISQTIVHSESNAVTEPRDSFRLFRTAGSLGSTTKQTGAFIARSTIQASCNHHEFGIFSVVFNYSETSTTENVGMYSQISNLGNASGAIWAGVFEVKNINQSLGESTTVENVLCGVEIDVDNKFTFNDSKRKIGISIIARGGGENTEAIAIKADNNTRGNGTFNTGHWRHGLRFWANSIDKDNDGACIRVETSHSTGIQFINTAASTNYAMNLAGSGSTGINIGSNYTNPIAVQANKKIKLNGEGNTQGIYWDSTNAAITLDGNKIGVNNHLTSITANAGGVTIPATCSGFWTVMVNGFEKKIPFFEV